MERLTERLTDKSYCISDLRAIRKELFYEDMECRHGFDLYTGKAVDKLAEYENFEEIFYSKMADSTCEFLKDKEEFAKWLDRNRWIAKKCDEYARAEEQEKLLKLPCAVGDTVYRINKGKKEPIIPILVIGIAIRNKNELVIQTKDIADDNHNLYSKNSIGKTVFLTREEAEAALKELRDKKG